MTGKQMLKLLKEHGFKESRIEGSHHIMSNGTHTVAVPVHGNKDLKIGTQNTILKGAGLK